MGIIVVYSIIMDKSYLKKLISVIDDFFLPNLQSVVILLWGLFYEVKIINFFKSSRLELSKMYVF